MYLREILTCFVECKLDDPLLLNGHEIQVFWRVSDGLLLCLSPLHNKRFMFIVVCSIGI